MPTKTEQTINRILTIAERVATPLSLSVVDVRFSQQGRRKSLEVTISKPKGPVSLSDCEKLSRELEALIDAEADADGHPLIEGAFVLEVQSPGIERQLKTEREFSVFAGRQVKVLVKEKIGDLGLSFTGILGGLCSGKVLISQAKPLIENGRSAKSKSNHKKNKPGAEKAPGAETSVAEVNVDQKNIVQVRLMEIQENP